MLRFVGHVEQNLPMCQVISNADLIATDQEENLQR